MPQRLALHQAQVGRHGEAVPAHRGARLRVGQAADAHRREVLVWVDYHTLAQGILGLSRP